MAAAGEDFCAHTSVFQLEGQHPVIAIGHAVDDDG